jgi:DNA-directed RNA polymerase specialized sigma24 family protein
MDDEELRSALRSGDPHRLRAAFDRHYDAMALLLRPWSRDENEVDRMIEGAWAEAICAGSRVPERSSARAWLFSFLQQRFEEAPREQAPPGPGFASGEQFAAAGEAWEGHWREFPERWDARVERWLVSPEGQAMITAFLLAASPTNRLMLVLRDLDGWSPYEVAALTGLLPEAQSVELTKARKALRDAISLAASEALETQPRSESLGMDRP